LVNDAGAMNSRRKSRLLHDLSYACELADEAGVQNGWVRDGSETFALVFAVSSGDLVFRALNDSLGADAFSREPIDSNNSWVLVRAISELMTQEKGSTARRSTRIPTNVLLEVQRNGVLYSGETITVNLHGALARIPAPLKRGDRVSLHVHHTDKSVTGIVVFENSGGSQFGIELQNPENIWGVAVPPADWKTGQSDEQSFPS
jgi:hypothetical protein